MKKEKAFSIIEKLSLGGRIAMLEELLVFANEKQGEQKPFDYENANIQQKDFAPIEPKFREGDTMRTLQEAADGYTDGMPVVISVDKEYYHCTNELIAIKDQDDYEYPPMNRRQKPADKVEPKFHEGEWITIKE